MARPPSGTQLTAKQRRAIKEKEVALGAMGVCYFGTLDRWRPARECFIEGREGARAFVAEDLPECRLESLFGGGIEASRNRRRRQRRNAGIEVVRHWQTDAPGEFAMIAVCSLLRCDRREWRAVKVAQGYRDMHVLAACVGVHGGDPGCARRREPHEFELHHDNAGPGNTVSAEPLWKRQGRMQHALPVRERLHSIPHDNGIRSGNGSGDELRATAQVVVGEYIGVDMERVVGPHVSICASFAELGNEVSEFSVQLMEVLRLRFEHVEREADASDQFCYGSRSEFGFQGSPANEGSTAPRAGSFPQSVQTVEFVFGETGLHDLVARPAHGAALQAGYQESAVEREISQEMGVMWRAVVMSRITFSISMTNSLSRRGPALGNGLATYGGPCPIPVENPGRRRHAQRIQLDRRTAIARSPSDNPDFSFLRLEVPGVYRASIGSRALEPKEEGPQEGHRRLPWLTRPGDRHRHH